MKFLVALILLAVGISHSQVSVIGGEGGGGAPECDDYPRIDIFPASYTPGSLDGQGGWYSAPDATAFTIVASGGLRGTDAWGQASGLRNTNDCEPAQNDSMYAWAIVKDIAGTSDAETFGLALRMSANAETMIFMGWDESAGRLRYGHIKDGTKTDEGSTLHSPSDGDTLKLWCRGDSIWGGINGTVWFTDYDDADYPVFDSCKYVGMYSQGRYTDWYITKFQGGPNPP